MPAFFFTVAPELLIPGRFPPGGPPPGPVRFPSVISPLFEPVLLCLPVPESPDCSYCVVCNFGFEPPPIDDFPAILNRRWVRFAYENLPDAIMKRSGVSCHYFRAIWPVFVKDLVKDSFLLEAVDVVRGLRRDQKVLLLAYQSVVGGLGHLMLLLWSTIVYLLEQVVLLLTHQQLPSFLLALLQLVLEGLGVNANTSVGHDLLACVGGDADPYACLAHSLDARVEREQVVLQVYDLDVWLRQWATHHVLLVEAPLVGNVEIFVDRRRYAGGKELLVVIHRFLCIVSKRARS